MSAYIFYNKKTGEIQSQHQGHPKVDFLSKNRQEELLKNMFGFSSIYYDMGVLVNEGYDAIFFPDVLLTKEIDGRKKDFVDLDKLEKIRKGN